LSEPKENVVSKFFKHWVGVRVTAVTNEDMPHPQILHKQIYPLSKHLGSTIHFRRICLEIEKKLKYYYFHKKEKELVR
jgi:hypothetical protein